MIQIESDIMRELQEEQHPINGLRFSWDIVYLIGKVVHSTHLLSTANFSHRL
jgi:hypothetical protein